MTSALLVARIPDRLLDEWRKADEAPAYAAYEPTNAERRAFAAALDGLPPRMKDALRERLVAFYFVANLKGNGVTDLVLDASSRAYCYTILNPAAFRKTVSQVLTERERSAFRGSADVSVEAGGDDGILIYREPRDDARLRLRARAHAVHRPRGGARARPPARRGGRAGGLRPARGLAVRLALRQPLLGRGRGRALRRAPP